MASSSKSFAIGAILLLCSVNTTGMLSPPPAHDAAVFFDKIGQTTASLGYIHVNVEIPLGEAQAATTSVIAGMAKTLQNWNHGPDSFDSAQFNYMAMETPQKAIETLLSWTPGGTSIASSEVQTAFKLYGPQLIQSVDELQMEYVRFDIPWQRPRNPRFVGVAAVSIGAATFMGLLTQAQLYYLNSKTRAMNTKVEGSIIRLDKIEATQTQHGTDIVLLLQAAQDLQEFNHATTALRAVEQSMNHAQGVVFRLKQTLNDAGRSRLSPYAIHHSQVPKIYKMVQQQAAHYGMEPIFTHPGGIFQCEASFATNPAERIVTIMVHVPITRDPPMDLYMHHPLPVPVPNTTNTFILVTSALNLLAVDNAGHSYRTGSTADLALCSKRGSMFLCPRANVKTIAPPTESSPPSEETCLISLYLRNWKIANSTCQHVVGPLRDEVIQVGPNTFRSFNTEHHRGTIICAPGITPPSTDFQAGPYAYNTIPDGCVGRTRTHEFTGTVSITGKPEHTKVFDWPAVYDEAFAASAEQIRKHQLLAGARSPLAAAAAHTRLLADALQHDNDRDWIHDNTSSALGVITTTAIVVVGLAGAAYAVRHTYLRRAERERRHQAYLRQRNMEMQDLHSMALDDHFQHVHELKTQGRYRDAAELEANPPVPPKPQRGAAALFPGIAGRP